MNLAVVNENRMGCYDTEWCMETEHFECDIVVTVSWVSIEPAEWSNKLLSLERFTERITVWSLYWIYIVVVRDTFFPDRSLFFKTMDPSLKKLAQKNHVDNYISSNQVTTIFNRFPTRRYQQRDIWNVPFCLAYNNDAAVTRGTTAPTTERNIAVFPVLFVTIAAFAPISVGALFIFENHYEGENIIATAC